MSLGQLFSLLPTTSMTALLTRSYFRLVTVFIKRAEATPIITTAPLATGAVAPRADPLTTGVPQLLDNLIYNFFSQVCSLLVQPQAITVTVAVPQPTVHLTLTAPAVCVTTISAQSTVTLSALGTTVTTITVSTQPPVSTSIVSLIGPATTLTQTSQSSAVTTSLTVTPPTAIATFTSQLAAVTSLVTVTVTVRSTVTLTIGATSTVLQTAIALVSTLLSVTQTTRATTTVTTTTATATATSLLCNVNASFKISLDQLFLTVGSSVGQCKQQCLNDSRCKCSIWATVAQQCYGYPQACPQVIDYSLGALGFILNDRNCP